MAPTDNIDGNINSEQTILALTAEILGVPVSDGWAIVDRKPGQDGKDDLVMVRYNEKISGHQEFLMLDGIIVSLSMRKILVDIPALTCRGKATKPLKKGANTYTDVEGDEHTFMGDEIKISRGQNGVLIRVWTYDGKLYISTRRKIDASNSRWGNESKTFVEMYAELGGSTDLFSNGEYSNQFISFLVVHNQLASASRQKTEPGVLIYLGTTTLWTPTEDEIENLAVPLFREPKTKAPANLADVVQPATLAVDLSVSIEDANGHLGFNPTSEVKDYRLGEGGFVLVHFKNEDGTPVSMILESLGYNYRETIHGTGRNLKHRYMMLIEAAQRASEQKYNLMYARVPLPPMDVLEAQLQVGIPFVPSVNAAEVPSTDDRNLNIWANLLCSVPPHRQMEVFELQGSYHKLKKRVGDWIINLLLKSPDRLEEMKKEFPFAGANISTRLFAFMENNSKFIEKSYKKGNFVQDKRGRAKERKRYRAYFEKIIRGSISKENAGNVYSFDSLRRKYEERRAPQE